MPSTRVIAVIDIGTNSTKLLVARAAASGAIEVLRFARSTTRVGRALLSTGRISQDGTDSTARAVERFARSAARHDPAGVFAFSTFALRSASNARRVLSTIERRTGVAVRVLSGREEARLAFLSAHGSASRHKPYTMVVDVGGGSTECVLARSGRILTARSLPLGALHMTEAFLHSDPVSAGEYAAMTRRIRAVVRGVVRRFPTMEPKSVDLVASGGSATTAASMALGIEPGRTTGSRLTRGDLGAIEHACLSLSLARRKRLPGLSADRADIILPGIAIVLAFMNGVGKRVLRVNAGGVREGALIHLARNDLRW